MPPLWQQAIQAPTHPTRPPNRPAPTFIQYKTARQHMSPTPPSSARKRGRPPKATTSSPPASASSASSVASSSSSTAPAATATTTNKRATEEAACQGKRKDGSACNRKAKGDCAHGRCVACCERLAMPCAAHEALIKKRKEEEAMLEGEYDFGAGEDAALRIHPGEFKEPAFEMMGDTVVLFSLRDFLRVKKWSKDALEQGLRRRRGKRGLGGRDASNGSNNGGVGGSSKREMGLASDRRRAARGRRVLARLVAAVGGVEEA